MIKKLKNNKNYLLIEQLKTYLCLNNLVVQKTKIKYPIIWISRDLLIKTIIFLKQKLNKPYSMLYDLHGIDERLRKNTKNIPKLDYTVFYHLISIERNHDIILKVALSKNSLYVPTISNIFINANWYERETWEMFGIKFINHPNLTHLIMPKNWIGHPLCKDYLIKATEQELNYDNNDYYDNIIMNNKISFDSDTWKINTEDSSQQQNFTFLNLGPNHPSVHGVFRLILQLKGEQIINCIPDIGYHHRGAEKISEFKTWHNYIPYTDRIEYLGGCINEMPYILAIEKLAGIKVSERIKVIRIMLSELFRINSHLLYIGTYIHDLGGMTPIFLIFTDRQKIYNIIEHITGARMHPAWFRIGGLASDLPKGWQKILKELINWLPKRLNNYIKISINNSILRNRTKGVAAYNSKDAINWGVTGSALRATGINFDIRKCRPYSGYENFDFDVPIGNGISDCYNRLILKIEEIFQSINILKQCLNNMPSGPFKIYHNITTPINKNYALNNIESLINHFINVSWGPSILANESLQMVEATKGINSYYLISDGGAMSYRTRIRTPSFPHLQQIPSVIKGSFIPDLISYLGSIDFVMSDVDR
ncbi:MAG: NADH-quinone oxidoreductase subunit C/D [Candidatus Lightella neohaematopini]|nr:NADH-quinone oxidoreductase subunit C/D [Candidatus Lightella neohaematopini]